MVVGMKFPRWKWAVYGKSRKSENAATGGRPIRGEAWCTLAVSMADNSDSDWIEGKLDRLGTAILGAAGGAKIGVSVVLMDGALPQTIYMNDVGAEILGQPKAEVLRTSPLHFLDKESQARSADIRARQLRGEAVPPMSEAVVIAQDGRRIPVEFSMSRIALDGRAAIVAFFVDITNRRLAVEALARSEARFRMLTERAPDAIWIFDGRRLRFVNLGAVKMLGYPDVETLMAIDPRGLVHPDDGPVLVERTARMMATGEPLEPREYRTFKRDGSLVPVEVLSLPIEWEGVPAILSFGRDVTSRREMEARLMQADRLAALGTLLAGIAHEINNPLTYVLLGVDQALTALQDGAACVETARRRLAEVREGAERVASIVNHLRSFSRSGTETRGPVALADVTEAAARFAHNELRHRARLSTSYADVPAVLGSASQLEQVVLNLLVNAAQSLPEASAATNEIAVSLRHRDDRVILKVRDNGVGIPEDVLPRVFDPFFSTKPTGIGMGLGLSICHGIIVAHGGSISVQSQPGQGTTFRLELPAYAPPAVHFEPVALAAGSPPAPLAGVPRRRRLVIVDDESSVATMLGRFFQTEHDVTVFTSGPPALEFLASHVDVDLVLCDVMMPGMSGPDLFTAAALRCPGIERRFVFMTGGAFTPSTSRFLNAVPNRRLEKPFSFAVLGALFDVS